MLIRMCCHPFPLSMYSLALANTIIVDIEALKHSPNSQHWAGVGFGGMRHRRDSLSGLSTQSQPLILGSGLGGTHSPAPTFHSGIT